MQNAKILVAGLVGLAAGAGAGFYAGARYIQIKIENDIAREYDQKLAKLRKNYQESEKKRSEEQDAFKAEAEVYSNDLKEARKQFDNMCEFLQEKHNINMPWEEVPSDMVDYNKISKVYKDKKVLTQEEHAEETKPKVVIPDNDDVAPHLNDESLRILREMKDKLEGDNIVVNKKPNDMSELTPETENQLEPYIISEDVFLLNEKGYEQTTVTYFVNDSIVSDERDYIINDVYTLFGDVLDRLQNAPGDVYYVRNNARQMEIEVVLDKSSFSDVTERL